jgi:hypothetical protein
MVLRGASLFARSRWAILFISKTFKAKPLRGLRNFFEMRKKVSSSLDGRSERERAGYFCG